MEPDAVVLVRNIEHMSTPESSCSGRIATSVGRLPVESHPGRAKIVVSSDHAGPAMLDCGLPGKLAFLSGGDAGLSRLPGEEIGGMLRVIMFA